MNSGASSLSSGATTLSAGTSELAAGSKQLASGVKRLDAGAEQLSSGASSLASGANTLRNGAHTLSSGTVTLADGTVSLYSGALSAYTGSAQITDGAEQLTDGSATLTKGLLDAEDGSWELADGLDEGVESLTVSNTEQKAEVMSAPVKLDEEEYTSVKNYGTGFAPYFISLGLWVGALMASFVFKPLNRRLIYSGGNPVTIAFSSYVPLAVISAIQALLLLVVLQFALELQIDDVAGYYGFGILIALVFAAIMQLLMSTLGFSGKFIAVILLMLQLTSAAGTFPIEQTPAFFQTVNPFMPMTYCVEAMRQIMTGLNYTVVWQDVGVMAAIGVGCFLLTALVAYSKRLVRMDDLHPVLDL